MSCSPRYVHGYQIANLTRVLRDQRGHFRNDRAAAKLIYLALRNVEAKWKNPPIYWHQAKPQFAIHFEERFVIVE